MKKLSALLVILMTATLLLSCTGPEATVPDSAGSSTLAPQAVGDHNSADGDAWPVASDTYAQGETTLIYDLAKGRDITFTYWYPFGAGKSKELIGTFNKNEVYIEMEKRTGIKVDFIHPAVGQETEQYNLMVASEEYTDWVTTAERYKGGIEKGIVDEVYIDLTPYINTEHTPAFARVLEQSAPLKKQVFSDAGYFLGFGMITSDNYGDDWTPNLESPWPGPFMRGDMLKGVGMEVPTTVEEWYQVLKAVKEKYNPEVVLSINRKARDINYAGPPLLAAFGGPMDFYRGEDNKIHYGPAEDFFAEYLTEMAKWYSEGLIDAEFAARDSKAITQLEASLSMFAKESDATGLIARTNNYAAEQTSDAYMVGVPYPKKDADTPLRWHYMNHPCRGEWTMLFNTENNQKYLEEALRWFDYGYSIEGANLYNFGVFGQSHTGFDEKGMALYADYITADNYAAFETYQEVVRRHNGPYLKSDLRSMYRRRIPEMEAAREEWGSTPAPAFLPPYTLNDEEGREAASIMADIETFVDEAIVNYIMGTSPATEIPNIPATVRSMGIDKVIALHEVALARYNNR